MPIASIEAFPLLLILAVLVQVSLVQILSILSISVLALLTQILLVEQATLAKKTVTSDRYITSKEVLSSTQVFNSCVVNEIKDLYIEMDFYIWSSLKTLSLISISSNSLVKLTTYHPYYEKILNMRKWAPFLWALFQLSSLPLDLPAYIGKFTFYHSYHNKNPGFTKSAYNLFLLRPLLKLLLSATFSDYVGKLLFITCIIRKNRRW